MRAFRYVRASLVMLTVWSCTSALQAQAQASAPAAQALRDEIDQLKRDFDARLAALEAKLAALGGGPPAAAPGAPEPAPPQAAPQPPTAQVPAGAEAVGGPTGTLPVYGNVSASSKIFNPDIAVIGNFLGAAGNNPVRPEPALQMPESEASFQAIVDPYARADFFLAFAEQGVDLEEGFVTFPTVPGGLLVRAGKMRAAFGKVNMLHTHVLPWADRPLVTQNLVNGEEGISDAGFSVSRLITNPWIFLEATGQVFRGDSGTVFRSARRRDLSYVGHVRGYHDLTESANVDLGVSYARGNSAAGFVDDVPVGRFRTELVGVDATVRWRPLQRAIYHSFVGRSEVIWSRRDGPAIPETASGFYVSGDYQPARRWFTGLRFDRSDRPEDPALHDTGQSFVVTYWPSEFSQIRGQLRRTRYADAVTANEFLFQLQFAIGAHGAHPF